MIASFWKIGRQFPIAGDRQPDEEQFALWNKISNTKRPAITGIFLPSDFLKGAF